METHYTKIYTGNFIVVQLITDKLAAIDIIPVVKDLTMSGRGAIFGSSIPSEQEVYVNNDELDKAVPIVEAALAEMQA